MARELGCSETVALVFADDGYERHCGAVLDTVAVTMRVFITGASGHIASGVIPELLAEGHEVIGLARSDAAAEAVRARGGRVQRGDLDDLDVLHETARQSYGVIHLAFNHDFDNYLAAAEADLRAVQRIGDAL